MKTIKILGIAALLTAGAWIASASAGNGPDVNKGFAVVELFTSEGCSSCPPADAVIEKISKETGNKPVYILAYHVDYWDRGGWKDVFSNKAYTKHQNDYANWLNLSSIYTPQVVVNGKTEFVGSQEGTLRNAISNALQHQVGKQVDLGKAVVKNGKISVPYTSATGTDLELVSAIVQPFAKVNVKGGENGGQTLSHIRIVREFHRQLVSGKGNIELTLPEDRATDNWEVIAFLQNRSTGEIVGADKTLLN